MIFSGDIGSDVASVVLFDPKEVRGLPSGLGQDLQGCAEAGACFLIRTGTDGSYLVRICVDEEPEPRLMQNLCASSEPAMIGIRSGTLFCAGGEAIWEAWENDRIEKPSMGEAFQVPAGDYAITGHVPDWGDDDEVDETLQDHLRGKFSLVQYQLYERQRVGGCGCLIWPTAALVAGPAGGQYWGLWPGIGVFLGVLALWFLWAKLTALSPQDRALVADVMREEEEYLQRYPDFVILMRRIEDAQDARIPRGGVFEAG